MVAVVLDLPAAIVQAQNAKRAARIVDTTVVDRHRAAIRRTVDEGRLTTEGVDHVVLLRTSTDVDDLRIERRPATRAPA